MVPRLHLQAVFLAFILVSEDVQAGIVGECQILWLDPGAAEVHQRHLSFGVFAFRFFLV